jgi:hypothetical protein
MQIWHAKALQHTATSFPAADASSSLPIAQHAARKSATPSGKAMREARLFLRPRSNLPPVSLPIFVVSFAGCAPQLFPFPIMDILRRSLDYALLGSFKRKVSHDL